MCGEIRSPHIPSKAKKAMEKKIYEMPEVEVIDLTMETPILTISVGDADEPQVIGGEGDAENSGLGD